MRRCDEHMIELGIQQETGSDGNRRAFDVSENWDDIAAYVFDKSLAESL